MELRTDTGNPQSLVVELEFVPLDQYNGDPIAVGEVSRDVVAALEKDGYVVKPVYTGERGGFLFAIPMGVMLVGQAIAAHQDLLVGIFKTVQPVIEYIFKQHGKKANSDVTQGQTKIVVEIDGAFISIEAPDVESAERLLQRAEEFRIMHPSVAANVSAVSKIKIKGAVPKRQQRRRR